MALMMARRWRLVVGVEESAICPQLPEEALVSIGLDKRIAGCGTAPIACTGVVASVSTACGFDVWQDGDVVSLAQRAR